MGNQVLAASVPNPDVDDEAVTALGNRLSTNLAHLSNKVGNKVSNKLMQRRAVKLRKVHYKKVPLINGVTNNVTNKLGCCNFRGPLIDCQNVYAFAIELLT